jgi:hypothetical protein
MVVAVRGLVGNTQHHRSWHLVAEAGDGPFIPAIPGLIAIGKLAAGDYPPGARPALGIFTLAEAEAALQRLRIRVRRDDAQG